MFPNIFELIQQFCPYGVEYRRLGDVCRLVRGRVISKSYVNENLGEYPVFSSQTENDGVFGCISTYDFEGEFVTWTTDGAYAGSVFYRVGRFSITNVCGLIKPVGFDLSVKFLYFLLSVELRKHVRSGNNPKCMSNMVANVSIPVPPLPVQQEIVRILDTFDTYRNDVTAGLAGELAMRRKQFQYWQEKLLSFDDSVPRKALGDVANIDRGIQFNKKDMKKVGTFPVINGGIAPSGYVEVYNQEKNTLVISQGGASAGYVNWMDVPFWAGAHCYVVIASRTDLSNKYLYYVLKARQQVLQKSQRGSGIPALPYFVLEKLLIPIPPLVVQQEIVRVLDVFVELERELERELELRAKQFEYYRDHLLAFPEKKGA